MKYLEIRIRVFQLAGYININIMSQYIVVKKKNRILTPEAAKYNLRRTRLIANHSQDRNAKCMIYEVVERINPEMNEDRERL